MTRLLQLLKDNIIALLILATLATAWFMFRTTPSDIASLPALEEDLQNGQPTIIEFYSNTGSACFFAKPMVDGLTKELAGRAQVIKIDVWSQVGRQLVGKYRVRAMPTFVILDGAGNVYQQYSGIPDKATVLADIESLETR